MPITTRKRKGRWIFIRPRSGFSLEGGQARDRSPIGDQRLLILLVSGFWAYLGAGLVWGIGLSLDGTTGYAINPAGDFGPHLAHGLLPIAGKGKSDWGYAIVPILGPAPWRSAGGAAAARDTHLRMSNGLHSEPMGLRRRAFPSG